MDNDDDSTVILTDADIENLEKDIQSGKLDDDSEGDITINGILKGTLFPIH